MSEIKLDQDTALKPLYDLINEIMSTPEDQLNDDAVKVVNTIIENSFAEEMRGATQELIKSFNNLNYSRGQARENIELSKQAIDSLVEELKPSENKKKILDKIFNLIFEVFDKALEQYHSYDIKLPIKLDEGAHMPTYAHDTDAAADLYARETITLPAHSISNKIGSGVYIALPEGWVGLIFPRSSIGAKTGLRLSNSAGIIDSDYRGELGILYDNISDSDYTINAGDRIAQLMVMPSYRFAPVPVDTLDETERNDGGFGSSGK